MGLDVYLYERAEEEASDAREKAWGDWYEKYKDVADEAAEKKAARDALPKYEGTPTVPSQRYPGHLFNRRYLRSSYNDAGFNRAVPDFLGTADEMAVSHGSLTWIFDQLLGMSDEYTYHLTEASIPALEDAKQRALQVADELRKCDPLRTMSESVLLGPQEHMWNQLPSEDQVLAWYRGETVRNAGEGSFGGDGGYSNAKGLVLGFEKGIEVLALTIGRTSIGRPAAVAVYRADASSYIESAEITAEFCDEGIMLVRRDGAAYVHWSG